LSPLLARFGRAQRPAPDLPFWHLQSDGLWLIPDAVRIPKRANMDRPTLTVLRHLNPAGYVPPHLWEALLANPTLVQELADDLLRAFWPPEQRAEVAAAVGLGSAAGIPSPSDPAPGFQSPAVLAGRLVSAALDFCAQRPWERHDFDTFVAASVPYLPDPLYATIMGAGGMEFGLDVFRGASAPHVIRRQMAAGERNFGALNYFGFSLTPLFQIRPPFEDVLTAGGLDASPGDEVPCFVACDAGEVIRPLVPVESESMTSVLRAIIRLDESGTLEPRTLRAHRLQKLVLTGTATNPDIEIGIDVVGPPGRHSGRGHGALDLEDA
jgi:hypothetical protein